MTRLSLPLLAALAIVAPVPANPVVRTEQLRPADPSWQFHKIPGPSRSDVAQNARVILLGNRFEPAGAAGEVLVNGRLPADSLDLSEEVLLANDNNDSGTLILDLGKPQPVAAVATYSWHEWNVDEGSRAPQVYALFGSNASELPGVDQATAWTKLADVDTRPNQTGEGWNGQHGAVVSDPAGPLGTFRFLRFDLQRTRSPKQPAPGMTGTLFSEIDVHTAETLKQAGDATVAKPVAVSDVWVVFKTHLDIGYTDRIEAVLAKYRGPMMDGALQVIEASRSLPAEKRFAWTLAGWPLAHVLGPQQDPARKARIEQAVREGSIAFHALPFTLHTESDDLEDLVRGLGFSSRLAREYGRPLPISGKMTDVPCHSWVWPTLLHHAGVEFLQLGCNGTSAFVRVPPLFWWEGPDGSRILCQYTAQYGSGLTPPRNWPSRNYLAMVMTGDNHGPPTQAEVDRLRAQAEKSLPGVRVHFGTLDDFARAVLAEKPELPVVRADMPDTWIHGWLSMPVEAKALREVRPLEPALETLDNLLRLWGTKPPDLRPSLAAAYEQSNLFSEHTFGPWGPKTGPWETGIPNRYIYGQEWKDARSKGVFQKYEAAFDDKRAYAHRAKSIVCSEMERRLCLLADSVEGDRLRTVVFNPLPWKRSGLVSVAGSEVFARDVPAGGYSTLGTPPDKAKNRTNQGITTDHYQIAFDLKRGGISSLVEKASGRQWVDASSPYVLGQFVHERFDAEQMQEFHNAYGRPGYSWPKGNLPPGTKRAMLTPTHWFLGEAHTGLTDTFTLTAGDSLGLAKGISLTFQFSRLDGNLDVGWEVVEKTPDPLPEGGWLCFPFMIEKPRFLLGRLGGPIDPARDIISGANRHYFCLNTGLNVTGADGAGIGLCPVDSPCVSLGAPGLWKFSPEDLPRGPAVFVNLYNNMWNTNFPEWIEGSWSSTVRLWPVGKSDSSPGDLAVRSWEARLPLLGTPSGAPSGPLPASRAGLGLSRKGVLVTAFGHNPDGDGTLLRIWDQCGSSGDITVTLPESSRFNKATPVDLRGENPGAPVPVENGRFTVPLGAFAPASFILR